MSVSFFDDRERGITEQEAIEAGFTIFKPNLPAKEGLCEDLPLKQRAAFILYVSRFTIEEIGTLLNTSPRTINRYITKGLEKYPNAKRV
jgi:DNA-directed RNA polymerase specialized sigma24 family protein